jgi:hypothetical protein
MTPTSLTPDITPLNNILTLQILHIALRTELNMLW